MYVRFGSDVYRDGVDLKPDEFYRKLIASQTVPTTSSPKMKDFSEAYDRLAEETDEILSIHLSSTFSSAYETAVRASGRTRKECHVEVMDSRTAAMGLGLVVIAAAKQAQEGQSRQQIIKMVKKAAPKARVYVCFETLEYLKRGGRIGKAESLHGIIHQGASHNWTGERRGETAGRERSRSRALDRLCMLAEESAVGVRHSGGAGRCPE